MAKNFSVCCDAIFGMVGTPLFSQKAKRVQVPKQIVSICGEPHVVVNVKKLIRTTKRSEGMGSRRKVR
ncbi:MAG: hypothetical protein PHD02_03930 [Bacilli bacterium]|nr:hypothetical protein [Bacilli bacterium]